MIRGRDVGLRSTTPAAEFQQLKRQAESTVSAVGIPDGASFDEMHSFMERQQGRRIIIRHVPSMRGLVCGLWISRTDDDADEICCDLEHPNWKQTVFHEWGHMLLGHGDGQALSLDVASSLAPLIPRDAIRFALGRSSFTDHGEAAAEAVADVLGVRFAHSLRARRRREATGGFRAVL